MGFKNSLDLERFVARKHFPLRAYFQLTFRCNFKCLHCYLNYPHTGKELTFAEINTLLKQLVKSGSLYAVFTGGEIFMRRDAMDILEAARKLDFAVSLYTNASLITEEIAKRISWLYPRKLRVTLYGANEKAYQKVTGKSGMFRRSLKGIQHLIKFEVPLRIVLPIFNFNTIEEISAMQHICDELGAPTESYWEFSPKTNGTLTPLEFSLTESQLREFSSAFPSLFPLPERIKMTKKGKACALAWSKIWITPFGQIGHCDKLVTKSTIREKPILEIWRKDPKLRKLRKICWGDFPRVCSQCDSFIYCLPCPAKNFLSTGNFIEIPSFLCKQAKIKKRVFEAL